MAVVLAISSTVVVGHVGNSAAVFALQRLGHEVWPLATIMLAHHPGHDRAVPKLVTPAATIADFVAALGRRGWLSRIDAVLVGYIADRAQATTIAEAIATIRAARPDVLVALDPVIGDDDRLYVDRDIAEAIRDRLLPMARIATPNRFELGWLAGKTVARHEDAIAAIRQFACPETILTSAPGAPQGMVRTLLVSLTGQFTADAPRVTTTARGTGDLMAALFLGHRLNGVSPSGSLARANGAVRAVIAETARRGLDELALTAMQDALDGGFEGSSAECL